MNKEIKYWKWKNTIIDFNTISDEELDYAYKPKKKDWVFRYLGVPDNDIHEWYNGGFSCEYNKALEYAKELGLVEDYIDYEEKLYNLKEENQQLKEQLEASEKARKEAIDEIKELYDNTDDPTCYDIDKDEKERLLQILDIDKGE